MPTLYEYYNTGADTAADIEADTWMFQTFTPLITHRITKVVLLVYRSGPGTIVTVGIRATDGAGEPTGPDLTSGTFVREDLTVDLAGEWKEIELTPYVLQANTKYVIVLRVAGAVGATVSWRADQTAPTYTRGEAGGSVDGGSSWIILSGVDMMFEEWGDPIVAGGMGIAVILEALRQARAIR